MTDTVSVRVPCHCVGRAGSRRHPFDASRPSHLLTPVPTVDGGERPSVPRSCSCTAPAISRTRTWDGRGISASSCSTRCSRNRATSCSTWTTARPPGYGRDWRTAIYRQMGTPELEDLEDGVRYLVENENVDPAIGLASTEARTEASSRSWRCSRQPDLFACGAALRPVTDWAHYNHPYTSRISEHALRRPGRLRAELTHRVRRGTQRSRSSSRTGCSTTTSSSRTR